MPALSYHERSPDALHRLSGGGSRVLSCRCCRWSFPREGEELGEVSEQDEASCHLQLLGPGVVADHSWPRHADGGVDGAELPPMDRECYSGTGERPGGSRSATG